MKKKFALSFVALASVALLAACGEVKSGASNAAGNSVDEKTIKIGFNFEETGAVAAYGTSEQKGGLFDATVYKAKVAGKAKDGVYYPLKTSNSVVKDVAKYGGFTKIKIAYYSIFEYVLVNKKGEEKITRIIPIPIFISQNIKDDNTLVKFGRSHINLKIGRAHV